MRAKEASELLGVERTKLRDYERKFHVFTPENERADKEAVDYTEKDIHDLKRLVLLNRATLTCSDIRDMQEGKRSLIQALEDRAKEIREEYERKMASRRLGQIIAATGASYETLDVETLWDIMQGKEQEGTEFFMEDDDPRILVRIITCPYCGKTVEIDLEDCLADSTCTDSQRDDDMGPDVLYEFDPQVACQCPECEEFFSVFGWLREYPIGVYDSDDITTKPYEEE